MKRKKDQKKQEEPNSLWHKTQYANLIRYVPSGTYFARFRIKSKLVWRSLKTDRVSIAHIRLPDEIEKERRKAENSSALAQGKMTGGDAIRMYNERISIEVGIRFDNPAKAISRVTERSKRLQLPEPDQFRRFIDEIENSGSGFSKPCADLVRFLAYGGFRIKEARHILWADCDLKRGSIAVRGEPETGTKGAGDPRAVPMIPDMRTLLERLSAERLNAKPTDPVMRVRECQKSMDRAAKVVGMPRITHHDLRHLFATRCIESGVDIPTVSRWLGHKDGGALAMRVYGHLRDSHSVNMAQKVTFNEKN